MARVRVVLIERKEKEKHRLFWGGFSAGDLNQRSKPRGTTYTAVGGGYLPAATTTCWLYYIHIYF
jgi:hypothetical protein